MTIAVKHITAEQFFDGSYDHCELVEGEVVQMTPGGMDQVNSSKDQQRGRKLCR